MASWTRSLWRKKAPSVGGGRLECGRAESPHSTSFHTLYFSVLGFPLVPLYSSCFSAEVSYLFIHEEVVFPHVLDYTEYNSSFKALICSLQHLGYLRARLHWCPPFWSLGHVFLFLHMPGVLDCILGIVKDMLPRLWILLFLRRPLIFFFFFNFIRQLTYLDSSSQVCSAMVVTGEISLFLLPQLGWLEPARDLCGSASTGFV